jgi:hypothetical protein
MVDRKDEVLTGYHRPFQEDETFRDAMKACNKAKDTKFSKKKHIDARELLKPSKKEKGK